MSETRDILLLSGGKDSTALALYMKDNYPEIELEYVFNDTHKELPETYEYLSKIEGYLGKEITRLTTESGGFDHFLKIYGDFLPNHKMRWCTKELKIKPFEKYVGTDPVNIYVGIRADENRKGYISTKPNMHPVYPFIEDGIAKDDVLRILEDSGLGLPDYYSWRSRSGCYFCFFQRKVEWVKLKEEHPDLYELAKQYEKPDENFTWSATGESLVDMEDPERIESIKENHAKRQANAIKNRKPQTLGEMFAGEIDDFDEESGCLICHL